MLNHKKLLTISIPTWNRDYLLYELLEKLISQVINDRLTEVVEILISNNGSTDKTHEICKNFAENHSFISYYINEVNIGARANVIRSMKLARSSYLMFLGDDDRLSSNAILKIINLLKTNSNLGLILDISRSKLNEIEENTFIDLSYLLKNYYWYLGNAGLFIIKSDYVKDALKNKNYESFNSSWPQTQIIILGLNENPDDSILISKLDLVSEAVHDQVMVYNSYYLWRTCHFDLFSAINSIKNEITNSSFENALKYLKSNVQQLFFNILQCGVFVDNINIKLKTAKHIFKNMWKFSIKEICYFSTMVFVLILPNFISRPFSNIAIYLIKGNSGLKKKSVFVLNERIKKINFEKQKTNAIRPFEFDPEKA
ncbi:MAG TPA: glycosyltransferase family A protein [Saprospiraceae bacterium]|nr:glycosyltransferase family A protein [Saprospiraceae bacterium]